MLLCASHHLERVEGLLILFARPFYIIVFGRRFLQMAIFNIRLNGPRGFGLVVRVQHMICGGMLLVD